MGGKINEATHAVYQYSNYHALRKIQNSYPVAIDNTTHPGYTLDYVSKWVNFGLYQHAKNHDIYYSPSYPNTVYKILKTEHYGTLTNYPKTWVGAGGKAHTITDHLTIPSSVTLTIKEGSTVQFSFGKNMTISGTLISEVDITIPSGSTLTINSGAQIQFASGKKLIVNGTLIASGTSSNRITFTSSSANPSAGDWNGIRIINGNSGSVLDYCEIKYATNGIYVDNTEIDVKNSFIHHNSYNGVSSVNGANVFLQYNSITYNGGYGVYGDNDSEVYLGAYYTTGGNRVNNNNVGMNCINDSYMFAGRYDWLPCYNSVYSNTVRAANAMFGGDIKTEGTWWGTTSPSSTLFLYNGYGGTIDYSDWLTYDPGYGSPLAKGNAPGLTSTTVNNKDPKSLYETGYYYYGSNNEMAVKLWKELIDNFPESEYSPKALARLFHLDKSDKSIGIQGYMTNIESKIEKTSKLNEKVKILKAYKAQQENNIGTASLLVNDMINSFKDSRA